MYRLTQIALTRIEENKPSSHLEVALALGCSAMTVYRLFRENVTNGDLTKMAALEVIREVTGLTEDEILESVPQKEAV